MSRFGTDSNAMVDSKAMVPLYSQPKPLNLLLGNFPYGRPKRHVVLPEVLCSPYVVRKVSLICSISSHERRAVNWAHFILMCMNVKDCVVQLFDNIFSNVTDVRSRYGTLPLVMVALFSDYMLHVNHPKHDKMKQVDFMIMPMGCNTKKNFVDCEVFMMRHIKTFKGDVDCCGFSREGKEHIKELKELRRKYVAKILLAD
ncbi:hypothetical protein Tco_1068855 [Tanacetum coccineum]|uniref:Ubiquitin-like protease family profile domain-containing protein n=1 Tax=Tanacetum coccineum TaxID=301880 RepID=A0ABQ5HGX6_9ASTR